MVAVVAARRGFLNSAACSWVHLSAVKYGAGLEVIAEGNNVAGTE